MDDHDHRYRVSASGLHDLALKLDYESIEVPAGQVREFSARLQIDPVDLKKASNEVFFELEAIDNEALRAREPARFLGPTGLR
jgi:hypothetical protein